jgi:hypothetical protein
MIMMSLMCELQQAGRTADVNSPQLLQVAVELQFRRGMNDVRQASDQVGILGRIHSELRLRKITSYDHDPVHDHAAGPGPVAPGAAEPALCIVFVPAPHQNRKPVISSFENQTGDP